MLTTQMENALNKQVNAELYSSYLYLSMESYFQSLNLPGFATWMRSQVQEEIFHAMKFYNFIHERGGKVVLAGIDRPESNWESPFNAFEHILAHEQKVTGLINNLMDQAMSQKDHATQIFLQWFVTEQVEEEDSVNAIVQKLKLIGDNPSGLFLLDAELGKRTFTMPTA